MKSRIAVLLILILMGTGTVGAVAQTDSTFLLVVYGQALAPDGNRNLPRGMEIFIRNSRSDETIVATIGETEYGVYEAAYFSVDQPVAEVGDTLFFSIPDAEFYSGNGFCVLTTEDVGAGMVRYNVIPDMISGVAEAPPARALVGSFPNPFNPRTTILLEQAVAGPVTLSLFDARGLEVCTLLQQELSQGPHEIQWNGRDSYGREMPSGVYFVKYRTGTTIEHRKITLVR